MPNPISSGFMKPQDEIYYVLAEIPESGNTYGTQTASVRDWLLEICFEK